MVDCVDNMNTTPLMHASAFGFPDLVSLLLKSGMPCIMLSCGYAMRC